MCAHPGANGGKCGLAPHAGDRHILVRSVEPDRGALPDKHVMTFD
jgi:hypothetical protein